jgi:hypothetical protein
MLRSHRSTTSHFFIHHPQFREGRSLLRPPPCARQEYIKEWWWRWRHKHKMLVRGIVVKATLPQQATESEYVACGREFGVVPRIELWRMICRVFALQIAYDERRRFEDVPYGEIAVDDSEGMQVCDAIDDVEHPAFDVLDPSLVLVEEDSDGEGSSKLWEHEKAIFRPT